MPGPRRARPLAVGLALFVRGRPAAVAEGLGPCAAANGLAGRSYTLAVQEDGVSQRLAGRRGRALALLVAKGVERAAVEPAFQAALEAVGSR